jgi:hypothetical protein
MKLYSLVMSHPSTLRYGAINISDEWIYCSMRRAVARKPTITVAEEECQDTMDVSAVGALRACQSFYEPLAQSGSGRPINIVSLNSFVV